MLFKKFNHLLNSKEKKSVILLLFLIFIGMFLETLGVGIVIPVFTIIMDPSIADKYPTGAFLLAKLSPLNWFSDSISISTFQNQLITGAIMIIILVYIFKTCFLIFLAWIQSSFITNLTISWSDKLFSGYLFQPYSFHLQRNSALLIRNINQTGTLASSLELTLVLVTEILVVIGISSLLIITEPLGGAHRDRDLMLENLKTSIIQNLNYFKDLSTEEIVNDRKNKFLKIGRNDGFISTTEDLSSLTVKKNNFENILKSKKVQIGIGIGIILLGLIFLFI